MPSRRPDGKKPNILLFAIDSILADHMSCYGYPRLTTPHIDRFAAGGTLFEKTYSAHIPTTPAYSSMLTGRDCFGTEVVALRLGKGETDHEYRKYAPERPLHIHASRRHGPRRLSARRRQSV